MRRELGPSGRDEKWFVGLYERTYTSVLRYARRRVDEDLARDVAAETFLVAWRRRDGIPAEPLPWLYGVARGVLANESRRTRRQGRTTRRIAASSPKVSPDQSARVGEAELVAAALATLSDRDREVISLVAWDGLEPHAAAQVVGCSPGTFAVRLHRARRRLQLALANQEAQEPAASGLGARRARGEKLER
jgi:RNA polymerase sigma-70 factor (ECF subfamily)